MLSVLLGMHLGVKLLDYMVILCLTISGTARLFPKMINYSCVCVSSKPYFFFFVVYFNVTAILSFSTYKATSDSSREEIALCTLKMQKVAGTFYLYCAVRGTGDPRKSKDLFMFVLMYGVLRSPVQLLLKS